MSIFSRGTIVIQLCLNPPGHGLHQSCTGCCWHPLPLLHNDITELLDARHMVLLHLPLEDAPHVFNRVLVWRHTVLGHFITFTFSSKAVVILAVCLEWLCWKVVSEGRGSCSASECHSTCWIHVYLNEPQLPSASSTHAAPDHDATATVLDCRQGTIFLVLLTRAPPHMLDTI